MKNLLIKDFASRQDLDDYVKNELGDDIQANREAGHTISGMVDELKSFGLSTSSRIYGVKIVLVE